MVPEVIQLTDQHYTKFVEAYVGQYAQLHEKHGLPVVHLMSRRADGTWYVHALHRKDGRKVCVWCGLYVAKAVESTDVSTGLGPSLHVLLCDGCGMEAKDTQDAEAKARPIKN
jgi:hypothetical protein